jgi:hypothetical protein
MNGDAVPTAGCVLQEVADVEHRSDQADCVHKIREMLLESHSPRNQPLLPYFGDDPLAWGAALKKHSLQ